MRRRDFMKIISGAAAAWPLVARGQQAAMPVVGYLSTGVGSLLPAFRRGLSETGYVEGRSFGFEYRVSDYGLERLPALQRRLRAVG